VAAVPVYLYVRALLRGTAAACGDSVRGAGSPSHRAGAGLGITGLVLCPWARRGARGCVLLIFRCFLRSTVTLPLKRALAPSAAQAERYTVPGPHAHDGVRTEVCWAS